MNISEIPYPKVKAAAEKNQEFITDKLYAAFSFYHSPEGYAFWACVDNGWWQDAKEICPHLFEEEKTGKQKALDKLLTQWKLESGFIPWGLDFVPKLLAITAKYVDMAKKINALPENRFDSEGNILPEEKPVLAYKYERYIYGQWYPGLSREAPRPDHVIRNLVELVAK